MDVQQVLKNILSAYADEIRKNAQIRGVEERIEKELADYVDAENLARQNGGILASLFRKFLPDVLTNGRLYRADANAVVRPTMEHSCSTMDALISQIQAMMNEKAHVGIAPVVPELNDDQIDGIITGICNAESYQAGEAVFLDQVENFLEGHVDDWVHDNADFQYDSGLSPVIERIPASKCCKWCDQLAGTYPYEKVRDRGNDVFRRHKNCHCQIAYDPGNGSKKRQIIRHQEKTLHPIESSNRHTSSEESMIARTDVRTEYLKDRASYTGNIDFDDRFDHSKNADEERMARFLHQIFGGEIHCLNHNLYTGKSPDYEWNGAYWELKTTSTPKAADSAVRSALLQIAGSKSGGIILDITSNNIESTIQEAEERLIRSLHGEIDVIYVHNASVVGVYRYEK